MQTVSQSAEIVSYVLDVPRGRVNQIARALIDAGLLPKSRGKAIQCITGEQMYLLIAATAFAETVSMAPEVARAFSRLPVNGNAAEDALSADRCFAKLLDCEDSTGACEVEFAQSKAGAQVTIRIKGSEQLITLPFYKAKTWGEFTKRCVTLGAEGFTVLRNLFGRPDLQSVAIDSESSRDG